ncbi:MAG: NADH:flavin oxidoreductase, partial [Planctomycetes bacterium]|nr:NADH:flavin oxidoreductase [Planctomycetota bacterium]
MKLFEALTLRNMTLANRLVLPAMVTRLSGEDGYVNQAIHERYLRYAQGEVGLIVVEAMAVHQSKSGPLLRLGEDCFIEKQREMVKAIHDSSPSKVAPQIIHFLKIARSGWRQTVSMLSHEDIDAIVQAYADAAYRAREAGYDAVELHMAHAYTLSSFLSRRNGRRDDYGGSLENRLRLPLRVIEAVRSSIGEDFALGVRFDGEECIKDGYGLEDAREIALRLARLGASYVSISAGGKFEDAVKVE